MNTQQGWLLASTVLVAVALTSPVAADTYSVKPDGTGDFPTIQAAVDAAQNGDIILLHNGVFKGDGNRDINYHGKAITVRGESDNPKNCIIDCEGSEAEPHRGFWFQSGEGPGSVLKNVTVMGGYAAFVDEDAQFAGGGVLCSNGSPTFEDCIFTNNFSAQLGGGGMACLYDSDPVLNSCTFSDNEGAVSAGGMAVYFGATATLIDCDFTSNIANAPAPQTGGGGLVVFTSASCTLVNCRFVDNWSGDAGGGMIVALFSDVELTNCEFIDNTCVDNSAGVAIAFFSSANLTGCTFANNSSGRITGGFGVGNAGLPSSATLTDCLFIENHAEATAGAAGITDGDMTFTNCTFAGNSAGEGGGAVRGQRGTDLSLVNCTLFDNGAPSGSGVTLLTNDCSLDLENTIISSGRDGEAVYAPSGATVNVTCTDIYGNEGGDWIGPIAGQLGVNGNISLDPHFVNPGTGKFTLKDKSPCRPFSPPNGACDLIGAWPVEGDDYTGGGSDDAAFFSGLESLQPARRPLVAERCESGTRFHYSLAEAGQTNLVVYDATGRVVRHLVDGRVAAGAHAVLWNRRDDSGGLLSSGVYFAELRVDGKRLEARKITVLR